MCNATEGPAPSFERKMVIIVLGMHRTGASAVTRGLDLAQDAIPHETTILKFRHLLERQGLTAQMMNVISDTLEQRGLHQL